MPPTETNVCTYYQVDELLEDDVPIPIERSCENTDSFAVTADGQLAGGGETGELMVRGATVMKGYWGRPEKTAEVLISNPVPDSVPGLGRIDLTELDTVPAALDLVVPPHKEVIAAIRPHPHQVSCPVDRSG